MKLINPKLRKLITSIGRCELCGIACKPDCCHLFAKGHGGGRQLDVHWNLFAACRIDHCNVDQGRIHKDRVIGVIARRERCDVQDIVPLIWLLRRLDKFTSYESLALLVEDEFGRKVKWHEHWEVAEWEKNRDQRIKKKPKLKRSPK